MSLKCPNIKPLDRINIECKEGIPQLTPKQKYGELSIDSNGSVYNSKKMIIGWYRPYVSNQIQVKIYDSEDIFLLKLK